MFTFQIHVHTFTASHLMVLLQNAFLYKEEAKIKNILDSSVWFQTLAESLLNINKLSSISNPHQYLVSFHIHASEMHSFWEQFTMTLITYPMKGTILNETKMTWMHALLLTIIIQRSTS